MRQVTVKVELKGVSPLLMDLMPNEILESLVTGVRVQIQKDRPMKAMAAEKIYRDPETGVAGLPVVHLLGALKGAGRTVKNGKKQISTATSTTLFGLMSIQETFLPFTNVEGDQKEPAWTVDLVRGMGNQAKPPVAVGIVRPKFNEWAFRLTIDVDLDQVNLDTILKLFQVAGSSYGLASYRPAKNGPYGRFRVAKFEKVDSSDEEQSTTGKNELAITDARNGEGVPQLVGASS